MYFSTLFQHLCISTSDSVRMYTTDVLHNFEAGGRGQHSVMLSCTDAPTAVHTQEHTDPHKDTGAAAVSLVPVHEGFQMLLGKDLFV